MTPERWRQVEAIFLEAIELEADDRATLLELRCGDDSDLRDAVDRLLVADGHASSRLGAAVADSVLRLNDDLAVGQRVGLYEILSVLGQGGMGIVYRARRVDEVFSKEVAIKIVKRGMDTDAVLRRFQHERRILARFEHPYIARILDGASTEDGRPYLVMEFVEGTDFLDYCREKELGLRERLGLFLKVCEAIEYAHRRLIVHRDLKPSNILVDVEGNPRLLDFGIAKLLDDPDGVTLTMAAARLLTPRYASPEQVTGDVVGVASDVYSLGVLLYELLTNCPAYRAVPGTPTAILRAVCEEEVRPPSVVARTEHAVSPVPSEKLKGDLDRIVLMALEKDPRARYGSVQLLADDLRRYLDSRPVMARPQTLVYRTRKFARRHRVGLAAAAIVAVTLVAGIAATAYQAQRAERRFQEVRKLANTFMFEFHDKIRYLPGATEARALLVETALEYLDGLARDAGDDADLLTELAVAYQRVGDVLGDPRGSSLGRTDEAMDSYQTSLAIAERLGTAGDNPTVRRALATGYFKVGDLLSERGDTQQGLEMLQQGRDHAELLVTETGNLKDGVLLENILSRIGDAQLLARDVKGALQNYQRSRQLTEARAAGQPSDNAEMGMAMSHVIVGGAVAQLGDLESAFDHYSVGIEIEQGLVVKQPSNAMYRRELRLAYNWMGDLLGGPFSINRGDPVAAMEYYEKALAISEELAAADPANGSARHDLAVCYGKIGDLLLATDPQRSAEFQQRQLALAEKLLESSPGEFRFLKLRAASLRKLAMAWTASGDAPAALPPLGESLELLETLRDQHSARQTLEPDLYAAHSGLADTLLSLGKTDEALAHYRQAVELAEAASAAVPADLMALWQSAESYERLGDFHARLAAEPGVEQRAHWGEAEAWYQRSLQTWDEWARRGTSSDFDTKSKARVLDAIRRSDEALAALRMEEIAIDASSANRD